MARGPPAPIMSSMDTTSSPLPLTRSDHRQEDQRCSPGSLAAHTSLHRSRPRPHRLRRLDPVQRRRPDRLPRDARARPLGRRRARRHAPRHRLNATPSRAGATAPAAKKRTDEFASAGGLSGMTDRAHRDHQPSAVTDSPPNPGAGRATPSRPALPASPPSSSALALRALRPLRTSGTCPTTSTSTRSATSSKSAAGACASAWRRSRNARLGTAQGAGKRIGDGTTEAISRLTEIGVGRSLETGLARTERALAKLDEGTYGLCDACGEPIAPARLRAMPDSASCAWRARPQERRIHDPRRR